MTTKHKTPSVQLSDFSIALQRYRQVLDVLQPHASTPAGGLLFTMYSAAFTRVALQGYNGYLPEPRVRFEVAAVLLTHDVDQARKLLDPEDIDTDGRIGMDDVLHLALLSKEPGATALREFVLSTAPVQQRADELLSERGVQKTEQGYPLSELANALGMTPTEALLALDDGDVIATNTPPSEVN